MGLDTKNRPWLKPDWPEQCSAESIIKKHAGVKFPIADGRWRPGSMRGDMQEIYLSHLESGVELKKSDLIQLWRTHYKTQFEINKLRKQRKQHLRNQINAAKHIKALNAQIAQLEKRI